MTLHIGIHDHVLDYEHAVWADDAYWDGKKWHGLVATCHIAHSKVCYECDQERPLMEYLDCEVASRWTLMRTPTQ